MMSKIYELYSPDQRKIDNLKRRIRGYQKMEKDLQRDIRKTNNKNRELQKRIDKAIELNKQIKSFVYNEMVDRCVPGSTELYELVNEELKVLGGKND